MQTVKTPQINISDVRKHPCAFRVLKTHAHLTVVCRSGYQVDDVGVSMANGEAWACEQAIARLEKVKARTIHV